jgi:surface protein
LSITSCKQITIKLNGTETEAFFINRIEGRECPDQIIIDGILIPYSTCKYKFPNKIVTIGINWEKNITNFYRMFSDISNLKEIDLSGFNTSLVENMAYMFENCKSLIFANLSNVNINSVSNMQYMFSNCISLNSIDLTNVDIARISNKKNIFYNCINLKLDNILSIDNNKRQLGIDPEPYNQCDVNDFFNIDRECTINLEIADQKINEALTKESFMEFLSTTSFQSDDIISIEVENEIFSITRSSQRDTINLGVCEDELKNIYAIRANESLIIYIHEFKSMYFLIPIIGFEVFNNFTKLNLDYVMIC